MEPNGAQAGSQPAAAEASERTRRRTGSSIAEALHQAATTAPASALPDLRVEASARIRLARMLCQLALVLLPACIIATPWGLAPFAVLVVPAMLLAPDLLWASWRRSRAWAWPLLLLAVGVVGVVLLSILGTGVSWSALDNRSRLLLMPLFVLAVVALRPQRAWLWWGAVLGLLAACAVALLQSFGGVLRPGGWTNPIVFADVALGLMVVAAFCRPPRKAGWVALALLAGATAVLLTGSRGAWPGLAVIVVVAVLTWRVRFPLKFWVPFVCLLLAVTWIATPLVVSRMDALQQDAALYDNGHVDSSLGVRLDLLGAAGDAFLAHPWRGVGVDNFDGYLAATPDCREPAAAYCQFDHAHSDLPQWAATMGIPGLLAILALYGVPLLLFARRLRGAARGSASAAYAGVLFVAAFVLCGLTQSMFAHQLSASFYAVMVGLLAGFSIVEQAKPVDPVA